MAVTRRNAMLIAEARQKIRTTQLIKRLQDHVLGQVKMSISQIRAAESRRREGDDEITYRVADPACWKRDGGPLIAERMINEGVMLSRADKSAVSCLTDGTDLV